jgi:hypothetical protein
MNADEFITSEPAAEEAWPAPRPIALPVFCLIATGIAIMTLDIKFSERLSGLLKPVSSVGNAVTSVSHGTPVLLSRLAFAVWSSIPNIIALACCAVVLWVGIACLRSCHLHNAARAARSEALHAEFAMVIVDPNRHCLNCTHMPDDFCVWDEESQNRIFEKAHETFGDNLWEMQADSAALLDRIRAKTREVVA